MERMERFVATFYHYEGNAADEIARAAIGARRTLVMAAVEHFWNDAAFAPDSRLLLGPLTLRQLSAVELDWQQRGVGFQMELAASLVVVHPDIKMLHLAEGHEGGHYVQPPLTRWQRFIGGLQQAARAVIK